MDEWFRFGIVVPRWMEIEKTPQGDMGTKGRMCANTPETSS
jgi:hypothetical protein